MIKKLQLILSPELLTRKIDIAGRRSM